MYKSKYIKYISKMNVMSGGFACNLCGRQGKEDIISPNELHSCQSCEYIVCRECLNRIYNKCPQEKKITQWNLIERTHPNYDDDTLTTRKQQELTQEQELALERERKKAIEAEQELRKRAAESTQTRLPILDDPLAPQNFISWSDSFAPLPQLPFSLSDAFAQFNQIEQPPQQQNIQNLTDLKNEIFRDMTFAPAELVHEKKIELYQTARSTPISERFVTMTIPEFPEEHIIFPDTHDDLITFSIEYPDTISTRVRSRKGIFARTENGTYVKIREYSRGSLNVPQLGSTPVIEQTEGRRFLLEENEPTPE
jgi:hypothetical protein